MGRMKDLDIRRHNMAKKRKKAIVFKPIGTRMKQEIPAPSPLSNVRQLRRTNKQLRDDLDAQKYVSRRQEGALEAALATARKAIQVQAADLEKCKADLDHAIWERNGARGEWQLARDMLATSQAAAKDVERMLEVANARRYTPPNGAERPLTVDEAIAHIGRVTGCIPTGITFTQIHPELKP